MQPKDDVMPATKKIEQVQQLTEFLDGASLIIGAGHSGLSVREIEGLRRALRINDTRYRIVKNRLALRAAESLGQADEIRSLLDGPVGLIVTREEPIPVIQALTTYVRTNRMQLRITNAVLERQVITPSELERISTLPSREVLLAQVMGAMNGVNQRLVSVLHTHLSSIVNVLDQRRRQLEERS